MHLSRFFRACPFWGAAALLCLTASAQPAAKTEATKKLSTRSHSVPRTFVSPTAATDTPFFVAAGVSGGSSPVTEYTAAGQPIRTITFPANTSQSGTEYLRGIAATDAGTLVGFNGTFSPELTTYDPHMPAFSSQTAPGWEIPNNGTYGSIGVYQGYSFVINDGPNLSSYQTAIIRFNPDGTSQQFAVNTNSNGYVNLATSPDGSLYVLYVSTIQGQAPSWAADVYDPVSLQKLRTVNLRVSSGTDLRSLAVDAQGSIYAINLYNYVYHFDASGNLLQSASHGQGGFTDDIKIDPSSGRILISIEGTITGEILQADPALSSFQIIAQPTVYQAFDYFLTFTNPAVTAAVDGSAHIMWNKTDGTMSLWTVTPGFSFTHQEYGPYPGWTAAALAQGPDGVAHILWNHSADGQASVWSLAPNGSFTYQNYGPYPGWYATAISLGPDNKVHLLWSQSQSNFSLWTVNNDVFGSFSAPVYAPFLGLSAQSIATGADNFTGLLWADSNGSASLWRVNPADGTYVHHEFGPYNGWTTTSLSIGPDNLGHLLWNNTDGTASLWTADLNAGTFSYLNYGPYPGWAAVQVATGIDGVTHLLWNHTSDGQMSLWRLNSAGGFIYQNYGPYPGWTAVAVSAAP